MDETITKLIASTSDGKIKWYRDNTSDGSWYRAEVQTYSFDLKRGVNLKISTQGEVISTHTEIADLEIAIASYLQAQIDIKLTNLTGVLSEL